jgi:hypothetical protein
MSKPPTRAALAGARKRYDAGEPVGAVAADLGLSVDAFRRLRVKKGWPLRSKPAPTKPARAAPDAPPPARAKPMKTKTPPAQNAEAAAEAGPHPAVDLDALRARLERALQTELAAVERRLTSADPTEPGERNARALASLVKTFADLRRLAAPARAKAGADDDRPADARPERDLPALRAELARRLERLAGEGRGG